MSNWEAFNRWKGNLAAICGGFVVLFFAFKVGSIEYQLAFHSKSTYGTVDSVYMTRGRTKHVAYSFTVDGKKYNGTAWYDEDVSPGPGDFFDVKYSSLDPSISRLQMPE